MKLCPGGEIGRHKGLKNPSKETSCRFKSGPGHHIIFIRYFYEKFYSCWRRICWDVFAVLLAQKFNVKLLEIDKEKVKKINNRESVIKDTLIDKFFDDFNLKLQATSSKIEAFDDADCVIVATPTNYDENTNQFNTHSVENVIEDFRKINESTPIIIKSTIPVGFTEKLKKINGYKNIYFSPEFLREGTALHDNLKPSRIVVGSKDDNGKKFAESLLMCSELDEDEIQVLYTNSTEAEAIKLFSNTYLAMRVSFFNELDSYCEINDLSTKGIIDGVSCDLRIGHGYNNPSFGYGGYCLPKRH